jgi:hypothetical protein
VKHSIWVTQGLVVLPDKQLQRLCRWSRTQDFFSKLGPANLPFDRTKVQYCGRKNGSAALKQVADYVSGQ